MCNNVNIPLEIRDIYGLHSIHCQCDHYVLLKCTIQAFQHLLGKTFDGNLAEDINFTLKCRKELAIAIHGINKYSIKDHLLDNHAGKLNFICFINYF